MDNPFFLESNFHSQEWLNSLTMQNVRVLCYPIDDAHIKPNIKRKFLSICNLDTIHNQYTNKKHTNGTPFRLLEMFYNIELMKNPNKVGILNIGSRQTIIDYVTREKIHITAQFLLFLINDGAFQRLDFWNLCANNDFSLDDINQILIKLQKYSSVFKSLTIGGNSWIYETAFVSGPLRELLIGSLENLENLCLQQLPIEIDLILLLRACPNLRCLEIAQPSISGRELCRVSIRINTEKNSLPVCDKLHYLHLPSSANEFGLLSILSHFRNLRRLHCTPFEQLLDILDLDSYKINSVATKNILSNLNSLSIMHPLSNDACKRLIKLCPNLKHLRIEVQEGMNLSCLIENLKKIKKLELINSVSMPLDYTENIQPALSICGTKLESLSLELFDHINMTELAKFCPNLKHLSAQWFNILTLPHIRYYRLLTPKNQYAFPKLEKLRLRPRPHQALSESVINFLLDHSKMLKHIELYSCSELTDTVIDAVGVKNPLNYLESFIIRHGHSVTNAALCRLLSRSLAAGSLIFHDCGLGPTEQAKEQRN